MGYILSDKNDGIHVESRSDSFVIYTDFGDSRIELPNRNLDELIDLLKRLRQQRDLSQGVVDLAAMSAHELYEWAAANMAETVEPIECAEWFLHAYGSADLVDGDVPDWGQLAYRAELLETIRRHQPH